MVTKNITTPQQKLDLYEILDLSEKLSLRSVHLCECTFHCDTFTPCACVSVHRYLPSPYHLISLCLEYHKDQEHPFTNS